MERSANEGKNMDPLRRKLSTRRERRKHFLRSVTLHMEAHVVTVVCAVNAVEKLVITMKIVKVLIQSVTTVDKWDILALSVPIQSFKRGLM